MHVMLRSDFVMLEFSNLVSSHVLFYSNVLLARNYISEILCLIILFGIMLLYKHGSIYISEKLISSLMALAQVSSAF